MVDKEVRLIDANRFKETLARLVCVSANNKTFERITNQTLHDVVPKLIDDEPTIEAQPVKHGRWISTEELYYNGMTKCSCCNEEYYIEDIQNLQGDLRVVNYCPSCGCKLDLGGNNND